MLKFLYKSFVKGFDLNYLETLVRKFPRFVDLLRWEQRIRERQKIGVSGSNLGGDVSPLTSRPWKKLPNVRDFRLKVSPWDGIFCIFGLRKRFSPRMKFVPFINGSSNKYIDYMFARLELQVKHGRYSEASETLWLLMGSSAYLAACYNSVVRNGHRELPLGLVEKHLRIVKQLIRDRVTSIDFKRVYFWDVKKGRPLGVPSVPWRVYLHMYNNLLTQGRMVSETGSQHAYLPGRGVLTAGNKIVDRLKSPHIYESDFKGFFDNVSHDAIARVLKGDMHLPDKEVDYIVSLNRSMVSLPPERKLYEPDEIMENLALDWEAYSFYQQEVLGVEPDAFETAPDSERHFVSLAYDGPVVEAMFLKEEGRWVPQKLVGVPQGAPTSCSLATLALRPIEKSVPSEVYADDVLLFPDDPAIDPEKILSRPEDGLILKPKGCRWIKRDGVGLVDSFKYLGIRYYPPRKITVILPRIGFVKGAINLLDPSYYERAVQAKHGNNLPSMLRREHVVTIPEKFETETRKGTKLTFTLRESFLSWLSKARDNALYGSGKGKRYNVSPVSIPEWIVRESIYWAKIRGPSKLMGGNRLSGGFLSRMYIGDWYSSVKQNFFLTKRKDSGMAFRWPIYADEKGLDEKRVTVFTSSSFACNDLIRMVESPTSYRKPRRKGLKFRLVKVAPRKMKYKGYLSPLERWFKRFPF